MMAVKTYMAAHVSLGTLPLAVGTSLGKWVFVGTLVLLLIWLICMPRELIGQAQARPLWWRNVRLWAIVICAIQIWVYWQFA